MCGGWGWGSITWAPVHMQGSLISFSSARLSPSWLQGDLMHSKAESKATSISLLSSSRAFIQWHLCVVVHFKGHSNLASSLKLPVHVHSPGQHAWTWLHFKETSCSFRLYGPLRQSITESLSAPEPNYIPRSHSLFLFSTG